MKREGVIAVFERQTVYEFVHTDIAAGMLEDLDHIQDVINTIRALDQRYTSDTIPQGRKFTSLKDIFTITRADVRPTAGVINITARSGMNKIELTCSNVHLDVANNLQMVDHRGVEFELLIESRW